MLAPAMAWCPALLTAAPRRRRGCLTAAGAPGSLLAAAPPRPPFPQALPQFLELRTRRLQFLFQPLLSLYRLAMHSAVVARLPALLYYLAPQLGYLAPACRRAPIRTSPESSHTSFLSTPFRLCPARPTPVHRIFTQKADYVFGLKGNQGTLHKDVALLFDERQDGFAGHAVTLHESFEKGHGRLETRRVVATDDLAWLQKDHQWPGMRSVAKVESRRELLVEGKVEEETRYYISSLPGDAKQIGHAVRSHWGVENGLHWVMDMVFRDDECRIRSAHAPANFATIKHMASNLLRRGKGKHSMRASRHIAGWDEDFLYSLLTT